MTAEPLKSGYRQNGLYYPFFHVRDERWLKVAALYWPKIVRLVPDGYQDNQPHPAGGERARVARALNDVFLVRRPPGASVEAVVPQFLEVIAAHAEELRVRLCPRDSDFEARSPWRARRRKIPPIARPTTAVHVNQLAPALRDALADAGLGMWGAGHSALEFGLWMQASSGEPSDVWDPGVGPWLRHQPSDWVAMPEKLVAVYSSVLAEDFAAANKLQPTTDQSDAFAVTNNWTSERIAAVLLDPPEVARARAATDLAEAVGFLAINVVVPANLDAVPFERIIEIRERYAAEFLAFGLEVDEVVGGLAELSDIRDRVVLDQYLREVVTVRFEQPMRELRARVQSLTGDTAMMSINVKTELPTAALAGGAWLAGHPLIAGTSAAAIGLMALRRGLRQQREQALRAAPAASFLLHTHDQLQPRTLLNRTLHRLTRIAGTNTD